MRYIGSKLSLLKNIRHTFERTVNQKDLVVGDIFCGTAVVAEMFKEMGHKIIANDSLRFCYTLAVAKLEVNSEPVFENLLKSGEIMDKPANKIFLSPYDRVLEHLNQVPGHEGFIFNEYSPGGTAGKQHQRMYFSDENAKKIDEIRRTITVWSENGLITEPEACLLVSDLMKASNRVANIAGTYGCFMKHWDVRALKSIEMERSKISPSNKQNLVFSEDANTLVKKMAFDVLYLDPPYTWRHYGAYYHILETIAIGDAPIVEGKTGLRSWQENKSRYCDRADAVNALKELVNSANTQHLLLSYNSEGLISHDQIMAILSQRGNPECHEIAYRRYKSNSNGNQHKQVQERLYYVKIK